MSLPAPRPTLEQIALNTGEVVHQPAGAYITHAGFMPNCPLCAEDLQHALSALVAEAPPDTPRSDAQWTLDNIYTIARREANRPGSDLKAWSHVQRLCEKVGCQPRGVRKDNGDSVTVVPAARQEGGALTALVAKWRAEGAAKDTWHATMGIGWKACAGELEAALSAVPRPEARPEEPDTARNDAR